MSNSIITKLKSLVGDVHVIDNPAEMSNFLKGNGKPLAVVFPGNTAEVSGIMKFANEVDLKVSVAGALVDTEALDGGIALVMSRMNKVLEIDHENLVVVVEPGLLHKDLMAKVSEAGLNFPPEPYDVNTGSIGGCFAIGDSDSKSYQYGPTRTYLLGFEMVLPTGEILNIGNKCIKNVSGYDFIHFAVGSKGVFGIFTKLLVKLLPPAAAKKAVVANFESIHQAAGTFATFLKRNIHPTRLNLLSAPIAKEISDSQGHLALVDLEGFVESSKNMANEIAAVFTLAGGTNVKIIDDAQEYENLWKGWLALRAKLNNSEVLDFSVGPMKMPQALKSLEGVIGDLGSYSGILVEGLVGGVRLVLPNLTERDLEVLATKVNNVAMSFGGGVNGLLGHQLRCQSANDSDMWEETTGLLAEIRRQFDPKGVLNPGVKL